MSIKSLSAGRQHLISCYKVYFLFIIYLQILFTWFCLFFFLWRANNIFLTFKYWEYLFNLWQGIWYFLYYSLFAHLRVCTSLMKCQLHHFHMQIFEHENRSSNGNCILFALSATSLTCCNWEIVSHFSII